MTNRLPLTPFGWTALAVLALSCPLTGCSHSEPFAEREGTTGPFDPTPPVRLTLNPGHDGEPSWLADGTGILYAARQPERTDRDICLAELPPNGGGQRRLICDVPGLQSTTDVVGATAAAADGRLALFTAGNGTIGGNTPVILSIGIAPTLDAANPETVRSLPFTPPGGGFQDYAGYLHWLDPSRLVYVGERFWAVTACPESGCPLDTLFTGSEISVVDLANGGAVSVIAGTQLATGVAPVEDGQAILYTIAGDSRVYRRVLSSDEVSVVHDFGTAGIARDVSAAGTRIAAVVGGRITFGVDPRIGPVHWDSGGVLHVVNLDGGSDQVLGVSSRLYRRPALSPDGTRVVAEGFPLIIISSDEAPPDTLVNRVADLYLFGGEP